MDGVLVDSEPIHEKAQDIVCRQFGIDVPNSVTPTFKGWTEDRVYKYIAENYGTGTTTLENLIKTKHLVFASLSNELQLMSGALHLVQFLYDSGIPLGLVTSATKADQERAFSNLGLTPYFSSVITVEDVRSPKPDPEPYLIGASRLDVPATECLVIEDSKYGVLSALRAGCTVFGIATTLPYDALQEIGAHRVFHTLAEIETELNVAFSPIPK